MVEYIVLGGAVSPVMLTLRPSLNVKVFLNVSFYFIKQINIICIFLYVFRILFTSNLNFIIAIDEIELFFLRNIFSNYIFNTIFIIRNTCKMYLNKIIDSFLFAILVNLLLASDIIIIIICIISELFYGVWFYIGTYCVHI